MSMPQSHDVEVDAVIAAVGSLSQRPVQDHVEVYQQAHQDLRRVLDAAGPGGS